MSVEIVRLIKQAAVDAVNASCPVNVVFGTVETEKPLSIRVNQKMLLTEEFLTVDENLTDYTVNMEVNHVTEKMSGGAKDPSFTSHLHQYKGVKPFKVLNALKKGEKVWMLSVQGGSHYMVVNRLGGQR